MFSVLPNEEGAGQYRIQSVMFLQPFGHYAVLGVRLNWLENWLPHICAMLLRLLERAVDGAQDGSRGQTAALRAWNNLIGGVATEPEG